MYNSDYQVSLRGLFKFEFISLYGRLLLNSKPKLNLHDRNLLNLGCGVSKFETWINADFFQLRFGNLLKKNIVSPDWMLDLRFPLNCNDNIWDGVFTEHTLEHLYPDQALRLLQELYRTMKPGSWIRTTVPDLRKYVAYYSGQKVHEKFDSWETGCEAIRNLTQNYFHISLWDSEFLEKCLNELGFVNVKEVSFRQGTDVSLLKDKEERAWETLYMEAQKPIES